MGGMGEYGGSTVSIGLRVSHIPWTGISRGQAGSIEGESSIGHVGSGVVNLDG